MDPAAASSDTADESPRLTSGEAAEIIGVLPSTLHQWRWQKKGPPVYKVAGRLRYRRSDIEQWIEAQRIDPETT